MVVSTYRSISLKVVGSTMGVFMGEAYRFKAPKLFVCYSKANYLENRTQRIAKTANEIQNSPIFMATTKPGERGQGVRSPGARFRGRDPGRLNFRNVLSLFPYPFQYPCCSRERL